MTLTLVQFLQGIPDTVEVAVPVTQLPATQAATGTATGAAPLSGGPNASPLNLFPQVTNNLDEYLLEVSISTHSDVNGLIGLCILANRKWVDSLIRCIVNA